MMRFASTFATALLSLLGPVLGDPVIVGYYPTWRHHAMSQVNFANYTHVNIAFGIPQQDGTLTLEGESLMPQIVHTLHGHGTNVLLSIGGWTGSKYMSTIMKDPAASDTLTQSIISLMQRHHLDGIDIDWEYPGRLGSLGNNVDEVNDSNNFLVYLTSLRRELDETFKKGRLITLALRVEPFNGGEGAVSNVSEFARLVDFANLMQYDINGPWDATTGPLAPFNFEPGKGSQLSFVQAIEDWTKAGWPAHQLTAGVAFYGKALTTLVDMSLDPNNQYQPHLSGTVGGDQEDAPWADPGGGGPPSYSGVWQWKNLRRQGVLVTSTETRAPWVRNWDPITQTPWLFNTATKMFISYDDPQSLTVKVNHAKAKGLAGMMVWSMDQDPEGELLSAVRQFCS